MTEDEAITLVRDLTIAFLEEITDFEVDHGEFLAGMDAMYDILAERYIETSNNSG